MKCEKSPVGNICRTCLTNKNRLSKISESNITIDNTTKPVLELLNMLTSVELNEDWPDFICLDCLSKVTDICKFKIQCEASNAWLEKHCRDRTNELCQGNDKQFNDDVDLINYDSENDTAFADVKVENKNKSVKSKQGCNTNAFKCEVCSESFATKRSWMRHKKSHNLHEPLFCNICNKQYTLHTYLKKHIEKAHHHKNQNIVDESVDEFLTYICTICKKSFKSRYILTVHEKRHKLKGHFLCPICGKGFDSKGCLSRHTRVHTGEKKFECEICKTKFSSTNNLRLHSRTHSGVKPYLCTVCGKSFTHPSGLTYHIKTHTKEKNYRCDMCDKAFALQCHLDNHRKIHTGERPFKCKLCDKGFIKKIDLKRHEAVHSGNKPHVCSVCKKEFLRELHLHYHMMIHTEERPHKCSHCGKGFIRKYYLKDHIIKHHNVQFKNVKDEDG